MDKAIAKVTAAFAALNFTAENERVISIEAEMARMTDARASAEARCLAISQTLADWRGPDASAVADALLADASPGDAAKAGPNIDELKAEHAALLSGINNLNQRIEANHFAVRQIREDARQTVAAQTKPLIDAIYDDAKEAGKRIVDAYAALTAINYSMNTAISEQAITGEAVEKIACFNGLLPATREVDVPGPIVRILSNLAEKGPALKCSAPSKVFMY
jgi:hypothetical protein